MECVCGIPETRCTLRIPYEFCLLPEFRWGGRLDEWLSWRLRRNASMGLKYKSSGWAGEGYTETYWRIASAQEQRTGDDRTPTDSELPFQFKRLQFPILPYFAMTVSKAQGQTMQKVGIDLRTPCFCHGMLYAVQPRSGSCNLISSDACTRQNY